MQGCAARLADNIEELVLMQTVHMIDLLLNLFLGRFGQLIGSRHDGSLANALDLFHTHSIGLDRHQGLVIVLFLHVEFGSLLAFELEGGSSSVIE